MKKRILSLILALFLITTSTTLTAFSGNEYNGPVISENSAAYDFLCFMSNPDPNSEHKVFPFACFKITGSSSYRICKNSIEGFNDSIFAENECTVTSLMPTLIIYHVEDNISLNDAYDKTGNVKSIDEPIILSSEGNSQNIECTLPDGTYIFEAPYGQNIGTIRVVVNKGLFDTSFEVWKDITYGNLTFRLQNGEATLTGCDIYYQGELDIPSEVDGCPVTTISDGAFISCDYITTINLPKTVKYIETQALSLLPNLTSINVDESSEEFTSIDGVLFNKNKSHLVQYPMAKEGKTYTVPNTVHIIGFSSFIGCRYLEKVIIPDSVYSIDIAAFAFAESLRSITLPESIAAINDNAFHELAALENVYYQGTEEEWNNITFGEYNISLFMAAIEFKDTIKVYLNGEKVTFDQFPIIINDRTLVPMRAIFEAFGAIVEWDDENAKVISTKDDTTIEMTIGNSIMYKNGETISLDAALMLAGSRTLVPVRAVAESFECTVEWDAENRTVIITE